MAEFKIKRGSFEFAAISLVTKKDNKDDIAILKKSKRIMLFKDMLYDFIKYLSDYDKRNILLNLLETEERISELDKKGIIFIEKSKLIYLLRYANIT